jgi:hypothetical protein
MGITKIPATAQIAWPEKVTIVKISINRTFLTAIEIISV